MMRNGRMTGSRAVRDRRIRAWFGCSVKTIAKIWYLLNNGFLPEQATKDRLLWGLRLMKGYETEEVNAAIIGGVDEATFRRWSWFFVEEIANLFDVVVSFALFILLPANNTSNICPY